MAPYFLKDKYYMALQYSYYDNLSSAGNPKGDLADYRHASALYLRNNYRLAPKVPFLYHVVLDVNPLALAQLGNTVSNVLDKREFNLLVSQADLPSYNVDTDVKNQYNRKKVIQTKINYDPVNFIFHDDQAGLTTLLWESYFRYYYQDPNYARKNTEATPNTDVPPAYLNGLYTTEILNRRKFGLDRPRYLDAPFFNTITVHQLHSQNTKPTFTSYTLVNPLIRSIRHDTVDQGGTGTMSTQIQFEYESVMYGRGRTDTDNPAGFADPAHYDVTPSPLQTGEGPRSQQRRFDERDRFFDAFFDQDVKKTTQTDIDTYRKGQDLPTTIGEVIVDTALDYLSDSIFPQPKASPLSVATARAVNTGYTSADKAFVAELENNPKKLNDFTRNAAGAEIGLATGTQTSAAKLAYDALSEETKVPIRQSALQNAVDLTKGGLSAGRQDFRNKLSLLGVL